ncbi:MAG: Lrp/AsnC family transcriptional regulator [Gammaproteobacteria bacterium]|nr:Lrp/AsnC family transcriptional regulator [Gammaproteobacteria bacterium]MCP4089087.1 Lrp/AsnC family transcriptional regulator [Gammaproteobacteria bacterium]MCP4276888.1 Lrp/AsnC family transcriptional regulator [Gammaproteobacteria bacterium]MCP4830731.1 Lrp/AsnC family transcriptional regulator [Gammaproteobacteria bacterium]MCP4928845.1 Lrp/AsnC family transcriptional regulator [Gammaproteobacteria bacterium]
MQDGLPICPHPYTNLAKQFACTEQEIISAIAELKDTDVLNRFGVIVKHRRLGYNANAMVVWNIDDEHIERLGEKLAAEPSVTLCYQRPRNLPHWPYNLFTMLHGKERSAVIRILDDIRARLSIDSDYDVLFSTRCFKQRGARYF